MATARKLRRATTRLEVIFALVFLATLAMAWGPTAAKTSTSAPLEPLSAPLTPRVPTRLAPMLALATRASLAQDLSARTLTVCFA